jgi:hypothetical protein
VKQESREELIQTLLRIAAITELTKNKAEKDFKNEDTKRNTM